MSAVYEFESLDWVKNIVQANHNLAKKHLDPTAAFNFEEDFSVGTIHGKNNAIHVQKIGKETTEAIKLTDDDNVSILLSKTQDELVAFVVQDQRRSMLAAGTRVASGSRPPVIGLTDDATPVGATGTVPIAAEGSLIPSSTDTNGSVDGRPGGE
jgi:hypothetical protein